MANMNKNINWNNKIPRMIFAGYKKQINDFLIEFSPDETYKNSFQFCRIYYIGTLWLGISPYTVLKTVRIEKLHKQMGSLIQITGVFPKL